MVFAGIHIELICSTCEKIICINIYNIHYI